MSKIVVPLWVQSKAVYSTSWCRLVLIRERKQELISSFIPKRLASLGIAVDVSIVA